MVDIPCGWAFYCFSRISLGATRLALLFKLLVDLLHLLDATLFLRTSLLDLFAGFVDLLDLSLGLLFDLGLGRFRCQDNARGDQ